jgi:hypothetical protein
MLCDLQVFMSDLRPADRSFIATRLSRFRSSDSARRFAAGVLLAGAIFSVGTILGDPASAANDSLAVTSGGDGGTVVEVTSLSDDGPGSLRRAVNAPNRKIVFRIGGEIWLKSPITIRQPFITVAGETAPSPGISLMGEGLRVRGNDVIVRHIRVRIGTQKGQVGNRDGIGVDGSANGERPAYNILIENCSVTWAIDEGMVVYGPNTHNVVFRNNIVAESLWQSVHPKGPHSMGLLVGPRTQEIVVQGNLLAHNLWRNPVVAAGASAVIVNNLIYNPGRVGLHFYANRGMEPTAVSAVGNVVIAGPDTKSTLLAFQQGLPPGTRIYYNDNLAMGTSAFDMSERPLNDAAFAFEGKPPIWVEGIKALPVGEVVKHVLANAGARPFDRDATDRRIIAEVTARSGNIRNEPADVRLRGND